LQRGLDKVGFIEALGYDLLALRGKVGLASEAALHEKTACSRYFDEQAGKVNDAGAGL
jgi:hypothetical protein